MKILRLPYLVAVPIPTRDRHHRRIPRARCGTATERVMKSFSEWFGGATVMAWPAWELGRWWTDRELSSRRDKRWWSS